MYMHIETMVVFSLREEYDIAVAFEKEHTDWAKRSGTEFATFTKEENFYTKYGERKESEDNR